MQEQDYMESFENTCGVVVELVEDYVRGHSQRMRKFGLCASAVSTPSLGTDCDDVSLPEDVPAGKNTPLCPLCLHLRLPSCTVNSRTRILFSGADLVIISFDMRYKQGTVVLLIRFTQPILEYYTLDT